nr:hypothetical protein B0A51_00612 [Rachicladosporium sp. CCFEE 5018]
MGVPTPAEALATFQPASAGAYNPGTVVIFFDARGFKSAQDQLPTYQSYWLETKYRLGWPSIWSTTDLEPGKLRLVWYTHTGTEGSREYPIHMAYTVKEMYDSLSGDGFRPMILGWSLENPFPMIGGSEPPEEPKQPEIRKATTWSNNVSGHAKGANPHERVMAIIAKEEERQKERRAGEVRGEKDGLAV